MLRSERTTRRFYEGFCGRVHAAVSMLFPPIDPNERFRERRATSRRRKRLRRSAAVGTVLVHPRDARRGGSFRRNGRDDTHIHGPRDACRRADERPRDSAHRGARRPRDRRPRLAARQARRLLRSPARRPHGTGARREGRERRGRFRAVRRPPRQRGRRRPRLLRVARRHARGAAARHLPDRAHRDVRGPAALERTPGARDPPCGRRVCGATRAGLGWTNPYDRRVWKYNVDIAVAAAHARAGSTRSCPDYLRFPSDGVGRRTPSTRNRRLVAEARGDPGVLEPTRSSGSLPYGVSASPRRSSGCPPRRDLGIGQLPRRMAPYLRHRQW